MRHSPDPLEHCFIDPITHHAGSHLSPNHFVSILRLHSLGLFGFFFFLIILVTPDMTNLKIENDT